VTPGGVGQFVVAADGARLALNTLVPTAATAIDFTTRLQLTSLQPGLVYGIYLYGCAPAVCATQHNEIDIELATNILQPGGSPLMVQVNRYANEPLGAGNGGLVALPAGFDPLAAHNCTIHWSLGEIDYLVDGVLLSSSTTHIPQGPMQVDEIAWGPASDWAAAYSASLQPVSSAAQNQSFVALLRSAG
jgi:hypothetical protein